VNKIGVNIRVLINPFSPLVDNPFLFRRGFEVAPDVVVFSNGNKAIDGDDIKMAFDMPDIPLSIEMVSSNSNMGHEELDLRFEVQKS